MTGDWLSAADGGAVAVLRAALDAHGYDEAGARDLLGPETASLDRVEAAPFLRRRLAGRGPAATLVQLFGLGVPAPAADATEALGRAGLDAATQLELVATDETTVTPLVGIDLHHGLRLLRDLGGDSGDRRADHVVGLHSASLSLAAYTPRPRVARALDVGTGSGIHALRAASHADEVVATDVNPRAVRFVALNAALNGFTNVVVAEGSLFEPVAGERFDLIVSNPPFVISPESALVYRDSGLPGDEISRRIAADLPEHLTDGGIGAFIASWAHGTSDDWRAGPRQWLTRRGCDVLVFRHQTHDPLTYAATWSLPRAGRDYETRLAEWLSYYDELGIEAMTTATIVVRRRASDNWFRAEATSAATREPTVAHLGRLFAGQDLVFDASDDEVLASTLLPVEEHLVEQRLVRGVDGYVADDSVVTVRHGLLYRVPLDPVGLALLGACDGTRSVATAAADVAAAMGLETSAVVAAALIHAKTWMSTGLVTAASR